MCFCVSLIVMVGVVEEEQRLVLSNSSSIARLRFSLCGVFLIFTGHIDVPHEKRKKKLIFYGFPPDYPSIACAGKKRKKKEEEKKKKKETTFSEIRTYISLSV